MGFGIYSGQRMGKDQIEGKGGKEDRNNAGPCYEATGIYFTGSNG